VVDHPAADITSRALARCGEPVPSDLHHDVHEVVDRVTAIWAVADWLALLVQAGAIGDLSR
jgi:hypothetical protein